MPGVVLFAEQPQYVIDVAISQIIPELPSEP